MSEKKITFRINMDKCTHRLAYDIYMSISASQRSEYIRLAIILMHDRDAQAQRMKDMLLRDMKIPYCDKPEPVLDDTPPDMSEAAKNMLGFISRLNT